VKKLFSTISKRSGSAAEKLVVKDVAEKSFVNNVRSCVAQIDASDTKSYIATYDIYFEQDMYFYKLQIQPAGGG